MEADYYLLKDIPSWIFLLSLGSSSISQGLCFLKYQKWYKMLIILEAKDFMGEKKVFQKVLSKRKQSIQKKNKEMKIVNFHGHTPKVTVLVILKIFKLIGGMILEPFTELKQN